MRKKYETKEDRDAEKKIMNKFLSYFPNFRASEMPEYYYYDFNLITGDKVMAYAEVKRASNWFGKIGVQIFRYDKWKKLKKHDEAHKHPTLIIFQFADKLAYLKVEDVDESKCTIKKSGRTDRGDPLDIADHIYLPINKFKVVGEKT